MYNLKHVYHQGNGHSHLLKYSQLCVSGTFNPAEQRLTQNSLIKSHFVKEHTPMLPSYPRDRHEFQESSLTLDNTSLSFRGRVSSPPTCVKYFPSCFSTFMDRSRISLRNSHVESGVKKKIALYKHDFPGLKNSMQSKSRQTPLNNRKKRKERKERKRGL